MQNMPYALKYDFWKRPTHFGRRLRHCSGKGLDGHTQIRMEKLGGSFRYSKLKSTVDLTDDAWRHNSE
jgi:hypothetical protein